MLSEVLNKFKFFLILHDFSGIYYDLLEFNLNLFNYLIFYS